MPDRIHVYVTEFKGRTWPFVMQWKDPKTGNVKSRSSREKTRGKAERKAAVLEDELNSGRYGADGSIPWADYCERFEFEVLPGLKRSTAISYSAIINQFTKSAKPNRLRDADAAALTRHVNRLRSLGRSENTLKTHLRTLHAVLQWGVDQDLLDKVPVFPKIRRVRRSKEMKGRPISLKEFRRMLQAIPDVVGSERAASWRRLLVGFWLSGLRLREAVMLAWQRGPNISVVQHGPRLRLRIPGDQQKSGEDELYPLTPAFSRFLAKTPKEERQGWVFSPQAKEGGRANNRHDVGRVVSAIGRKAGVVVDEVWDATGASRKKFASAHDLRRSFGTRWALRVPQPVLQRLMRHADYSTTAKYYVRLEVEETERVLYGSERKRRPNTLPNTGSKKTTKEPR